jgi:hypothetical protein
MERDGRAVRMGHHFPHPPTPDHELPLSCFSVPLICGGYDHGNESLGTADVITALYVGNK